jgi:acetylornithine deacetylase/succinyl-diaminopimelate desuccinylase-like protein
LLVEELKAPPMTKAVKEALADVEIDGGDKGPQVDDWWGEPDLKPAERVYAANSFNILTYWCGTPGRPVNAIPPNAVANCQLRFIAGTKVENVIPALERHLKVKGHHLVKVTPPPPVNDGEFPATRTEPDHPWALFARNSLQRSSNRKPAIIPSMGGSICNDIHRRLGAAHDLDSHSTHLARSTGRRTYPARTVEECDRADGRPIGTLQRPRRAKAG